MSPDLAAWSLKSPVSTSDDLTAALSVEDEEIAGRSLSLNLSASRRHHHSKANRLRGADLRYLQIKGASARKMEASASVIRWFCQGRSSLEELILQLYFGHLSVSAVDSIMRQIWGKVDGAVVLAELVSGITPRLEAWLKRPLNKPYHYSLLHEVNVRYRRSLAENSTRLVVVAGIDHSDGCDVLNIAAVRMDPRQSSEVLVSTLAANGLIYPAPIIADSDAMLTGAIRRALPSCSVLPFYSEFERELLRGVAFPHRPWVSEQLVTLKRASGRTEARMIGNRILQLLRRSGYPNLSEALEAKLSEHLHYYDHSELWRTELGKVEKKIGAVLSQVREQVRIIGPIVDDQVLVWFAAAAFRRIARRSPGARQFSASEG